MSIHRNITSMSGALLLAATIAVAQPAPTPTATATPTLTACQAVQACIDTSAETLLTGCAASNPTCDTAGNKGDRFAVTATSIADRALATTKTAGKVCTAQTRKSQCNACYKLAKVPLKIRLDAKIFHGLLANAASIIEQRRQTACGALTK